MRTAIHTSPRVSFLSHRSTLLCARFVLGYFLCSFVHGYYSCDLGLLQLVLLLLQ
jgi:multisubunit Na+/H+ antiporter MnhB subunit